MPEKRAHQFLVVADFGKLCRHAMLQLLTLLQWSSRIAGTLGMTPSQFIRIQLGCVTCQKMQSQSAQSGSDISLHDLGLVRQSIRYQVERLLAPVHQLPEHLSPVSAPLFVAN